MNIKDLSIGDKVYIREDLEDEKEYQDILYIERMGSGFMTISDVRSCGDYFLVYGDGYHYLYSEEMIDWEKTERFREITFKEITQFSIDGSEITKGITYSKKEIVAKNDGEENDLEKAVMLLMLKSAGVTYGDIKKEVEKVQEKWVPSYDEKYYYVRSVGDVDFLYWGDYSLDRERFAFDNCFKSREEAEERLEKIKEILKGE